ncbi:hypothetical protein BJY59DRAFT_687999 [Rhodotorula toruloides]
MRASKRNGGCERLLLRRGVVGGSGLGVLDDDVRNLGVLLVGDLGVERSLGIVIGKGNGTLSFVLLGRPNLLVLPETAELAADRRGDDESDDHERDGERESRHVEGAAGKGVLREGDGGGKEAERGDVSEDPRPEGRGEIRREEARRALRGEDDALREDLGKALARLAGLERDGGSELGVGLDVVGVIEAVAADGEDTGEDRECERQDQVHVTRNIARRDARAVGGAGDARVESAVAGSSVHPGVGDVENDEAGQEEGEGEPGDHAQHHHAEREDATEGRGERAVEKGDGEERAERPVEFVVGGGVETGGEGNGSEHAREGHGAGRRAEMEDVARGAERRPLERLGHVEESAGKGRLVDKRNQVAEEDVELLHVLLRDKPELETEDAAAEDEDHNAARPLELLEILVVDLGSGSEGLRSQVGLEGPARGHREARESGKERRLLGDVRPELHEGRHVITDEERVAV